MRSDRGDERIGSVALSARSTFLERDAALDGRPSALAAEADEEVRQLLRRAEERAQAALGERRESLHRLADVLLEQETVEGAELRELPERAFGRGDRGAALREQGTRTRSGP